MSDWVHELFVEHADLFLKLLNQGWTRAEDLVDGMVKVVNGFGIISGNLLDLCCGNGRISIYMAKKGFKAVGVDVSETFIDDAEQKAQQHDVGNLVTFLKGDVREVKNVVGKVSQPFDIVVNAWTSIGYFSQKDDLNTLKQARELSREGAILFVAETGHTEFLSVKFAPTAYTEVDDIVILQERKYNPITAQADTSWTFYKRHGKDLHYIDRVDHRLHIYSPQELASLVRDAGWEPVAFYGNLATLQPMTPLTSLNMIAKAS